MPWTKPWCGSSMPSGLGRDRRIELRAGLANCRFIHGVLLSQDIHGQLERADGGNRLSFPRRRIVADIGVPDGASRERGVGIPVHVQGDSCRVTPTEL